MFATTLCAVRWTAWALKPAAVAATTPTPAPASSPVPADPAASAEERAPASTAATASLNHGDGQLLGIGQTSDPLKDQLASADGDDKESIFQKISRRYRLLTPAISGKR